MKLPDAMVIFITTADEQEARSVASVLLEKRLIACASVVPKVHSMFRWQGAIEADDESMLVLKTKAVLLNKVVAEVKSVHSYNVPEIIALPITGGSDDYLKWIEEETDDDK